MEHPFTKHSTTLGRNTSLPVHLGLWHASSVPEVDGAHRVPECTKYPAAHPDPVYDTTLAGATGRVSNRHASATASQRGTLGTQSFPSHDMVSHRTPPVAGSPSRALSRGTTLQAVLAATALPSIHVAALGVDMLVNPILLKVVTEQAGGLADARREGPPRRRARHGGARA